MTKSHNLTFTDVTKCSFPPVLPIHIFCPDFNPNVICSLGKFLVSFCVLSCCWVFSRNNTEVKLSPKGYFIQVKHSGLRGMKWGLFFFILKLSLTLPCSINWLASFEVTDERCLQICFLTNGDWTSKFRKITKERWNFTSWIVLLLWFKISYFLSRRRMTVTNINSSMLSRVHVHDSVLSTKVGTFKNLLLAKQILSCKFFFELLLQPHYLDAMIIKQW